MTEVVDDAAIAVSPDPKQAIMDDDDHDDHDDHEENGLVIGAIDVDEENDSSADDDGDELDAVEDHGRLETDSPGEASANYESANDGGGSGGDDAAVDGDGGSGSGGSSNGVVKGVDGEPSNLPPNLSYQAPIYNARNAGRKKSNPVGTTEIVDRIVQVTFSVFDKNCHTCSFFQSVY